MNESRQYSSHSIRHIVWSATVLVASLLLVMSTSDPVLAQRGSRGGGGSGGQPIEFQGRQFSPEQIERFREMRNRMRGGRRPSRQPEEEKPEEKKPEENKEEEKKDDEKKEDEEPKTIKRPTDGSGRLDPNRIRLTPDKNGLVQFNYNSQPWADVLQEYADAAKLSFDWMELPADGLNLVTQKKYTLVEARDLLNRHLLARGFTLLLRGEVLSAVKIDKIDPSLVPRVDVDELEDYSPHDFVRVRFKLPSSMDPNKVKEDVKALLNPKATIIPLLNTKRLLVIDSVSNLRSVRNLIYDEQSASDSVVSPQVYPIMHRRADYVADQIMIVLGLDPASRKTPQELQLETQRLQLMMQMQQKGKDVSKMIRKDGPPVHIAVDRLQNTLLINAPPELLPQIELTIKSCDVPSGQGIAASGGRSTKPHKTTSASTDAVVTALMDFGQLDPLTRLQSDAQTRTIFAYATESDHQKIEAMIAKLDKSGRQIHVIWLRSLPAQSVAGTLTALLVGNEEDQNSGSSRSRRGGFDFFSMLRGNQKQQVGFKAMADVENNRLIVWANEEEMTEVRNMLTELGESPDGKRTRNPSKVRVLEARSPEETARLLEQLKAAYPGKLKIEIQKVKPATETPKEAPETEPEQDKVTRRSTTKKPKFFTVQHEVATTTEPAEATQKSPTVNVTVTADGRIILSSEDPDALDQMEDLLEVIEPPRKDFDYFKLKHVYASSVVLKLEDYFEEELKGQTETIYNEWGGYEGRRKKDSGPATLGRTQLLRFVSDRYTNTLIVQGANAAQLKIIADLIEIYDEPPKPKDYYSRETVVIELQYSRAADIAKSLKEVYRELLSSKDKEFADREGGPSIISDERTYVFGEPRIDDDGEERPVLINFDGMLAIGTDDISNSLIISARKEVLDSVKKTVELLDKAATPDTMIHVHRVGGGILSAGTLQKLLKQSMSQAWPGGKPQQAAAKAPSNGQSNSSSDRDRERERARAEYYRSRSRRGR